MWSYYDFESRGAHGIHKSGFLVQESYYVLKSKGPVEVYWIEYL